MRRNCATKFLYWTIGLMTGCFLVLKYRYVRMCDEGLVSITPPLDRGQIGKPELYKTYHVSTETNSKSNAISLNHDIDTTPETGRNFSQEWLSCEDVKRIYREANSKASSHFRKENKDGNKDVFFSKIENKTGHVIRVVVKHASLRNYSSESEVYRYRSGQREIENLRKLNSRNWTGIPTLYGACVEKHDVIYVVSEIVGQPLCLGNGTDMDCALAKHMRSLIQKNDNSEDAALLWLSKITCLFKQFEEDQVFMEDISGINFYFHPETLDIFIVDADSMIFYDGIRMNSRSSCRDNSDCSRPTGNLWRYSALNHKIYYPCQDGDGYCCNNNCWGYDSTLHTCGIAQWMIKPFLRFAPLTATDDYSRLIRCMLEPLPEKRCSMTNCCEKAKSMLDKYRTSQNMGLP